jgi:hypothetical protein
VRAGPVGGRTSGALARPRQRRLPCGQPLVQILGVASLRALAQFGVAEHLDDLCQDLEVALAGRFGHEEKDDEANRFLIGSVKGERHAQPEHGGDRIAQALDATVRDRDAVAEPGRAEPLALGQSGGDRRPGDRVMALEPFAGPLEQLGLGRREHVDQNVVGAQGGGEPVHRLDVKAWPAHRAPD